MTRSPETIRLYNVDQGGRQLNLHLNRASAKTAPRLRRGVTLLPVLIPSGHFYDVCKELGCGLDEARRVIKRSPQVKAHEKAQRLLVREHPPSAATVASETAEQEKIDAAAKKMAELNPPPPANAAPPGINQVAAGLRSSKEAPLPVDAGTPSIPGASPDATAGVVHESAAPAEAEPTETAESGSEAAPDSDAAPTEKAASPSVEEPSTDWSLERLRQFAEDNQIDLGRSTNKVAVLKKVRRGMVR